MIGDWLGGAMLEEGQRLKTDVGSVI
jgi:hypothetical protein